MDNFYILIGDDYFLQKNKIQQLAGDKKIIYCDNIMQAFNKCKTKSLFNIPACYVVKNDDEFVKNNKLWEFNANNNLLIVVYQDLDKRKAFYKKFKNNIQIINHLSKPVLLKQLQKMYPIQQNNLNILIDRCENDLNRIMLEIDKLINYARYTNTDLNATCTKFLKHNLIYKPPKDAIFDLVDAILARSNKHKIYELLYECYAINENNLAIIKTLGMQFEKLLIVQNGGILGILDDVPTFVITKLKNNSMYTTEEICNIILFLHEVDYKFKIGKIDDSVLMEYILNRIL